MSNFVASQSYSTNNGNGDYAKVRHKSPSFTLLN